ncbi:hypothetical protein M0D21_06540 [Aquimarina sp. D1M17]|uniref:hypothetical protein n=1 Tax=Aquimarina acroporae TaxID=2937283 RepID=UPI0020C117E8|nr:hypothetical protein [Aquimarina acroporae]MCK8521215.1 hypothetical protein [Aquimarina acroporae]
MVKYKSVVLLLVFLSVNSLISQTITGFVENEEGDKIPGVTFLIKKNKNTSAISEFFSSDEQGNFSYEVKEKYNETLYFSSSTLGFQKQEDSIELPLVGKTYVRNFTLVSKSTELEEVVLVSRRPFRIKKDTVIYNPQAYKDGTEQKVEDLLKKIPGIKVLDNGSLKYRGKKVQEVQLDGDDLFGDNYSIGTKNISVDIIDKIEAIENYSKNSFLKGVESSESVALNLKLKRGKVDYSGNGELGLGLGDVLRYDLSSTVLGVSKKVKSFGVFSLNNIGLNRSSFDYFSTNLTLEEIRNQNLFGKRNINVTSIKPEIGNTRIRLNDEWSGNYNLIHKVTPKFKIRYNVFYLKDKLRSQNSFNKDFFFENNLSFRDKTTTVQKPEQGRFDVKMDYSISAKSLLEIDSSISYENILDRVEFQRDLEETTFSNLDSEIFFWKNRVLYSQKLNDSLVMQFSTLYSRNNSPQLFQTEGDFVLETNLGGKLVQSSEFRKEAFQNYVQLVGKKVGVKYNFSFGANFYEIPFFSELKSQDSVIQGFSNNLNYSKANYFSGISLGYQNKKWKASATLKMNYTRQNLKDLEDGVNNQFVDKLYPNILLGYQYSINKFSKISFKGYLDYLTPSENNLFSNYVVSSNRTLVNNIVSLELSKKNNYRLSYRVDDLSKNIELDLSLGYQERANPYLLSYNINNDFTAKTYFQAPVTNEDVFSELSISRYVRFLRTTFVHTSKYTFSNFKNVVNESNLRNNKSKNYTGDLFFKTSFAIPVNFENNFSYTNATFVGSNNFRNTNNAVKNTFRIIYKPNKTFVLSAFSYFYVPDLKSNNSVSFLDFSLRYKPRDLKWFSGRVIGRNLFDTNVFRQIDNSDFSTILFQSNLISRYLMVSLDLNF